MVSSRELALRPRLSRSVGEAIHARSVYLTHYIIRNFKKKKTGIGKSYPSCDIPQAQLNFGETSGLPCRSFTVLPAPIESVATSEVRFGLFGSFVIAYHVNTRRWPKLVIMVIVLFTTYVGIILIIYLETDVYTHKITWKRISTFMH